MPVLVSTYEAKAHFSRLIAAVEKSGVPVTICRNRKPVVDLVAHTGKEDPLVQDPTLRGARYRGDPCAPVSREDWPEDQR